MSASNAGVTLSLKLSDICSDDMVFIFCNYTAFIFWPRDVTPGEVLGVQRHNQEAIGSRQLPITAPQAFDHYV
jgi:hypothetical protein